MGRLLVAVLMVAGSLGALCVGAVGQAPVAGEPYTIPVHVDEVSVTFNALDEKDKVKAEAQVKSMCEKLLANTIVEEYRYELG